MSPRSARQAEAPERGGFLLKPLLLYFKILPTGRSEITLEEARELAIIFGEDGEMWDYGLSLA
jgi:hypothetical protein